MIKSGRYRQVLMTFQPCFGWPLVVVDRWSLFRGSFKAKIAWAGFRVVVVDRWSLFEGGLLHSFDCIGKNVAAQRYP